MTSLERSRLGFRRSREEGPREAGPGTSVALGLRYGSNENGHALRADYLVGTVLCFTRLSTSLYHCRSAEPPRDIGVMVPTLQKSKQQFREVR